MIFKVKASYLKDFKGTAFEKLRRFHNDDDLLDVEAEHLSDDQIEALFQKAKSSKNDAGSKGLILKITNFRNVRADPTGKVIGKLEALATALKAYITPSPNKWLFHDESDGFSLPYYVKEIQYHPAKKDNPASVSMVLSATTRGREDGRRTSWTSEDLGKTAVEILNAKGFYLETEAAVTAYWKHIEAYKGWSPQTGKQFHCVGTGYPQNNWYTRESSMERDGQPATVVIDDKSEEDEENRNGRSHGETVSNSFWSGGKMQDEDDDEESDEASQYVAVPVHPYVKVFDLGRHHFVTVHVGNLKPYVFDKTAASKLVLAQDMKDLVTLLVEGSAEVMEDIIRGKTGGTIVISTGPPGTGKTLTAEVFAESMERPLYVVQCSQLGTDEESVEKKLENVLARASRWKAILLIDEADVYVHARGRDLQQNAIVGVFLRVLEHYRGVLFLTSNRLTVIDDAIMSRATAWIQYEYPNAEQLDALWRVLSKQYKMAIPDAVVAGLVKEFPHLSGRNIKSLLKLATMFLRAKKATTIDVALFKNVSKFQDLETDEKRAKRAEI